MKQKLKQLKEKQKFFYDRTALVMDDVLRIRRDDNWSKKDTVIQEVAPRSYKDLLYVLLYLLICDLLKTEKEVKGFDQSNAVSDLTALSKTTDCKTDSHTDTQTSNSHT
ncbi:hypothetical protein DPX16_0350 [Anabarilius grahami]|uniref:Uncharacterized protein n=1 Tax=Anabarilius grahami TaxID=495550 RepID=A0A3N0YYT4_ANAGA|nr:hypothetical protein DPX16_0350 [Anabarilius grahami]